MIIYELVLFSYWYVFYKDYFIWDFEKASNCKLNNFGILEDLAIVDYLFCDKTGTLTKNELIFREMKVIDQCVTNSMREDVNQIN